MSAELPQNPYESPVAVADDRRVTKFANLVAPPADLRQVARWQRVWIVAACVQFFGLLWLECEAPLRGVLQSARSFPFQYQSEVHDVIDIAAVLSIYLAILVGAFAALKITAKTCGLIVGTVAVVLSLIPCFGILSLLYVSVLATNFLHVNGISVGLLGADWKKLQ